MSSYTTLLKTIIERYSALDTTISTDGRIDKGRKYLFDFNYPIFDEAYRPVFERNFIRNFYMNEIGFETVGLFKMKLENWLNLNMPYFNQLYKSELIKYNPLYNVDWSESYDRNFNKNQKDNRKLDQQSEVNTKDNSTSESKSESNQDSKSFDREISSDTPQSRLELTTKDGSGIIEYASNITENVNNSESETNSKTNTDATIIGNTKGEFDSVDDYLSDIKQIEDYLKHVEGKVGNQSYSSMINEFRSTFLRIDSMIMEECRQLFMLVY